MNKTATTEDNIQIASKRIIGSLEGQKAGPLVILLTGMHGNETAGVEAVSSIIELLKQRKVEFRGRVLGIRANLHALQHGVRYVDEDMNRIWFTSIIEDIRSKPEHHLRSSERIEVKRLLRILDRLQENSSEKVILADVHTFSAEGAMFTIPGKVKEHRELLSQIYAPMVFGIGESLRGTALKYYQKRGILSFALEGGQHTNQLTQYNITASLFLMLQALGCIKAEHYPEIAKFREHLQSHTRQLPAQTELVYQHMIEEGDEFKMRPGYSNFQKVKEGEWLASDRRGKIEAQCDGYILMPLYQEQGNDGFFIIKEHEA